MLGCIPAMTHILHHSSNPHTRHLSAILIRQKIVKTWMRLPPSFQQELKAVLLHSVLHDPEPLIKRAIAGVIRFILPRAFAA